MVERHFALVSVSYQRPNRAISGRRGIRSAQWLSVTSPWDLCRTSVPTERLSGIFFRKYLFRHHTAERADQNLREERMEERLRISAPGGSDPNPKFRMSPSAPLHPPRAASLAPDPLRPLRAGQTPRDSAKGPGTQPAKHSESQFQGGSKIQDFALRSRAKF